MAALALVDCNSFYASCETVFRPDIRHRPVVVLSNNDGMIVAANKLAKSLGLVLGIPAFQAKPLFRRYNAAVFSSNYALYGDLSARVMRTLSRFSPDMEVYSIDEAFLSLAGLRENRTEYCQSIKDTVLRWTGIPVGIGIGPTKTLAKLANKQAKKDPQHGGVLDLTDNPDLETYLARTPVGDIWGIGSRYSRMLYGYGVGNALQFVRLPRDFVKRKMTVVGLHTWLELQGVECVGLDDTRAAKKSIINSRSFGSPVTNIVHMREAVANYVSRAAEKLRSQGSVCSTIQVWIQTDQFKAGAPCYSNTASGSLAVPTAYTPELIRLAHQVLGRIYRGEYDYKKAGVMLSGIEQADHRQLSLFALPPNDRPRDDALMAVLDKVNRKWGSHTMEVGAVGIRPEWQMQRKRMSPRYTTCWTELPVARA